MPAALLVQSILLVMSQLCLLALCLHYRPIYDPPPEAPPEAEEDDTELEAHESDWTPRRAAPSVQKGRLFDFWQWEGLGEYIEFLAGLILVLGVLQLIFGRWMWYIDA